METETLTQTKILQNLAKYRIRPKIPALFKEAYSHVTGGHKHAKAYIRRTIDSFTDNGISDMELLSIAASKKYYDSTLWIYLAENIYYSCEDLVRKKGYKKLLSRLEYNLSKSKECTPREAKELIERLTVID